MRTLYAKLSIALLGLLLLLGAATAHITVTTSHNYLREVQQKLHRDLAGHVADEQALFDADGEPAGLLTKVFEKLMVINPDLEVYLLDGSGRILEHAAPPGKVRRETVELAPIKAFLSADAHLPIVGTDPRDPTVSNIFSATEIRQEERLVGYLYIVLASEQFETVAAMIDRSYILRGGVWMVGGSVLLALAGGLFVFGRVTARLRGLAREMAEFEAAGAITGEPRAGDEIDLLEQSFAAMSARIRDQLAELAEQDRTRRDMFANISHDVRTPLTHLQGYLETLLIKEESLTAAERREYLEIANQQSEKLGILVADLFELSKLDSIATPLDHELFSISELVQDMVQEFRLAAQGRGVEIDARVNGALHQVSGNLAAISRVLQNLLENALRYSEAGDRITVSVEAAPGGVRVAVSDTGPGIEPDEIEHIFDRFYTRSAAPGVAETGSGLGLSIARKALELHDSVLRCESDPGNGTTFLFELRGAAASS